MGYYNLSALLTLFFIITTLLFSSLPATGASDLDWIPMGSGLADDNGEFELDSESNRRILATSRYISYGAMQRNSVPCSRRGASYYNCRPGAQANPYSRGCSKITRCRS